MFVRWRQSGRAKHALANLAKRACGQQASSTIHPFELETLEPRLLLAADPLGLTAGYAFNETSGNTTADASGHGLTGTLTNGATFTTAGKNGNAVLLDGVNDFLNLGNPAALRLTGSVTISGWIFITANPSDDAAIISKRSSGGVGFQLDTTIDKGPRTIGFKLTNSSGGQMFRYGATPLQLNTWYYVTGVYNAAALTLDVYLNGQLDNGVLQGTVTPSQQNSTNNVNIGRRAGLAGFEFAGRIDDVRIADHALTADQIQTDMVTPLGVTPDTTGPSTPTGLTANPVSPTQINLTWAASTDNVGVIGYQVFRGGSLLTTVTATNYNNTGLTPNTTYQYQVRAIDAAGNVSGASTTTFATTLADTTAPSIPSGLTATPVSTTQINLTWSVSTDNVGVAGYQVVRDGVLLATVGTSSYNNVGLTAGTTYQYALKAFDSANNISAQSATVSATTPNPDTVAPTVSVTSPTLAATVSGTINLSAAASDNVGIVGVQFIVNGGTLGPNGLNIGTEDTTSPYSVSWDTTAVPNGSYQISARARDAAGNSMLSDPIAITVSNVQAVGLAAAYGFNEGSGTSVIDASGHGLTGTLTNGATYTTAGKNGPALALDGSNDYVNLGNPAGLQFTGSMTISAWVYVTSFPVDDAVVVSKRSSGPIGYQLDVTKDTGPRTIGFKLTTGSGGPMFRYGATALQLNTWYYIAGTYDAATQTLNVYLNGQIDNGVLQGTVSTSQQNSAENVTIGRRPGATGYEFAGRIDDVRIYNRALPQAQITTDMTTPVGQSSPTDPTPPTVVIDNPINNATVSDIVTVTAGASDNVGIAGVSFFVDGNARGLEDTADPYAFNWDTRTETNGAHMLTALARDVNGNTKLSAPVIVNVANVNHFQNEILATGLNLPTVAKFLPDGRMLVVEFGGAIKVLPPPYTTPDPTPFLQLTNVPPVGAAVDRGIMDLALDPNFSTNHYYYIFYTAGTPNSHDRLSRFTANATLTGTISGSEFVLYQDPQETTADSASHHGGAITFGSDGKIYFTVGDHFNGSNSQNLTNPRGKLHRINFDGTVPTDNPFFDGAGPNWDSIWAIGLRNPYRAYYDAPTNRLIIGDVGGNDDALSFEEVNIAARGANYGWPNVEGPSNNPAYTNPIYSYSHAGRDASITGGFVYHGTQFPSSYQGSYFYADYAQNWIKRLTFDANGNVNGVFNFEPLDGSADGPYGDIVHLTEGPNGALYYVDIGYSDVTGAVSVSKIHRISYSQSDLPPVVAASANPTQGALPLTVNFSSAGSSDPEGHPLTYAWAFGDGGTSTTANPTHTYTVAGPYQARLTVSDGVNSTLSTPISITVGNRPVVTIVTTPSDGGLFRAGDVITFSGGATDVEDQTLPASAFVWNIDFLHEGHVHPGVPISGVKSGAFTIPTSGHDFSGFTRYRITLTVTDSDGLQTIQSATIFPEKVNLTFNTLPGGLTLYLDGIAHAGPFVYDTLVGFNHTIEARNQTTGTNSYTFAAWSDGGAQQHTVTVPSSAQTYTANFTSTMSAALVAAYAFDETSGTTTSDASGHGINGSLISGPTFTPGRNGNAITLDGINDYVDLGNPAALQLTGSMTISAWIYSSSFPVDDAAIVSKRGTTGFQLDTTVDTGPRTIGFKLTNNSGATMARFGATTLLPSTWYYVTGVYNATTQTLDVYLNGVLDNGVLLGTVTSSQQNSTQNVTIGRRSGGTGFEFSGRIDDVRIYSRALAPAEILADMTTPLVV